MIPVIFRASNMRAASGKGADAIDEALRVARRESAAVIGITSAVGALGGFFIPKSFGASMKATGGPTFALSCFVAFYVTCLTITWWFYMRSRFLVRVAPSLAEANA
jgi:NNP family nitrate/nitrite transporter-like MFS transporter